MKEITVENFSYSNVKEWLSGYSHKEKVEFAVYCAELVIDLYTGSSDAPKEAIQAAKDWILNPSKENKDKCKKAAYAAYTAAAAATDATDAAATDAAYTAAAAATDAADAAAYTAAYASYATDAIDAYAYTAAAAATDAAYTAAYASYATDAKKSVKEKIIKWFEKDAKLESDVVGWKNGDECIAFRNKELCIYIGQSHLNTCDSVIMLRDGTLKHYQTSLLSKPLTEQQKKEQEREKEMVKIEGLLIDKVNFNNTSLPRTISRIIYDAGYRLLDKTGYRKDS